MLCQWWRASGGALISLTHSPTTHMRVQTQCLMLGNPSETDPQGKERCMRCIPTYVSLESLADRNALQASCFSCLESGNVDNGVAKESCLQCPAHDLGAALWCFDDVTNPASDKYGRRRRRGASRRALLRSGRP